MNSSEIFIDQDYYTFNEEIIKDHLHFVSVGTLLETALVVALCISTTTSNLITICTIFCVSRRTEVLDLYILSLSIANLLISTIVIPFSIAAKSNILGCYSYMLCSISGYLHVSLSAVYMYTFMWTSVDRYLAVTKPLRYDIIQNRTRCKCWILFSWVMATFLCCPPLIGDLKGHFHEESFMCLLDIKSMLPYSVTLACLVLLPSMLTLCYTYTYIFTTPSTAVKSDGDRLNSDHVATLLVTAGFVILWTPWGLLRLLENISSKILADQTTRFWLLFVRELHGLWTPLTLLSGFRRCQEGLRLMCGCCLKSQPGVQV